MSNHQIPANVTVFGSNSTCTLDTCPIEWSIYTYRPSLPANVIFTVLFSVIGIVHFYLGFRWRNWGFTAGMLLGCLVEIIGYIGRIIMWNNPFSFNGFMVQIVCLTIAPVFFTASIYVTLSKTIVYLAPELSRFKPQLFYYIFIPFDIVCLILQAAGGALSTGDGDNSTGVNISQAGLSLQVVVLVAFIASFADYMIRYLRSYGLSKFHWRLKAFFLGLTAATLIILARCAYRVAELKDGYSGKLIQEEVPFIILEGVLIVLAAGFLFFGHPGLALRDDGIVEKNSMDVESVSPSLERRGREAAPYQ